MVCLYILEIGVGTIIARYILKKQGKVGKVITLRSIATLLVGVPVLIQLIVWDQGENIFSIFLQGYRYFFGTGI